MSVRRNVPGRRQQAQARLALIRPRAKKARSVGQERYGQCRPLTAQRESQ
jgi:hypothetical protein